MALADKIKNILVEQLGCNEEEVPPDASLRDDLGMDELDVVEIVMACEEEFAVEIDDEEADQWTYVRDVTKTLDGKTAKQS